MLNVEQLTFLITVTNHLAETICNLQSNNFLASRLIFYVWQFMESLKLNTWICLSKKKREAD